MPTSFSSLNWIGNMWTSIRSSSHSFRPHPLTIALTTTMTCVHPQLSWPRRVISK
jgi:hypothetical protein